MTDTTGPIGVYGATGYTGTLVVAELVRRGLPHVISGRSAEKLQRVVEATGTDAEVRVATVDEPGSLRAALEGCAVVINCAGPFTFFGRPVIDAAIDVGAHYLDTTGEQPYMKSVFDEVDQRAQEAGVAVVPGMGFDYLPGDLIAHLVGQGRGRLTELVIAYSMKGFGATRGTLHSALEMLGGGDWLYEEGAFKQATGVGPKRMRFTFPEPIGRQHMSRYPSGEVVTVPRHVDTAKLTSLITSSTFAAHPALGPTVPATMPLLRLGMRGPIRKLADAAIDRLPEGPDEAQRKASQWTIVAVAHSEDGQTGRGRVSGSDVYGFTGVTAVMGAQYMAARTYERAGALAPAEAYDAARFLDALVPHGLSWEVEGGVREAPSPNGSGRLRVPSA